jgi:hypothetical protein
MKYYENVFSINFKKHLLYLKNVSCRMVGEALSVISAISAGLKKCIHYYNKYVFCVRLFSLRLRVRFIISV